MLSMSTAYKQAMMKTFRDQSYMLVTIGVISQEAQKDSAFVEEMGAEYLYLSNLTMLLDDYSVNNVYATMEQDFFKADGSMLFPPRQNSVGFYLWNQGCVTEHVLGSIYISFGLAYDIRGLTIDWGDNYPVDFTITNGSTTIEYTDNDLSYWTTEDIFDRTTYLLITPTKMSGGQDRLRINKIYMGVGITFENKTIEKATKSEFVSPICEQLPTMDFALSIENYGRLWDVENKESAIHYLETGQEVVARYGLQMDDGTQVWMNGCTTILADWEADDSTMSFTSKDKLDGLTETYYRGQFYPDGITLYDLAVDVFEDAGLDSRYYKVDEYLRDIIINNPLPAVTHKQCLQIIANAGRCKLYTDRTGIICIEANISTVIDVARMEISSDTQAQWSNLSSVIEEREQVDYATFSQDYFTANGQMYFLPKDMSYFRVTGYVSDATSDPEGYFNDYDGYLLTNDREQILTNEELPILFTKPAPAENPSFTIKLEAAMTYYSLNIVFMAKPPQQMILHTYYEGTLREDYTVDSGIEMETTIEHEFYLFDTMVFEFVQAQPNSRVYVRSVSFGEITDYTFNYRVMTTSPKGKQQEKVSRVDVIRSLYSYTDEVKTIFQQTIDLTDYEDYTFYFSSASYDVHAVLDDLDELTILDSSSWFITVDTSAYRGEHDIIVTGKAYVITEKISSEDVNTTGTIEEWSNPIISSEENAELLGEWLGNYFLNNIEYEITYRGEPRLDAGDICFLENKYVPGLQIQIYEHDLNFSGALSGTVKARRAVSSSSESGEGLLTADGHYILTADGYHIIPV